MTPERYCRLLQDPTDGTELCLEFQSKLREAILNRLKKSPVVSFGSRLSVDKALRSLKKEGLIVFSRRTEKGPRAWHLVGGAL